MELHELNPEFASGRGSTLESPRFISDSGVKDCKGSHDIRNFGNQRVCLQGFYGIVSSRQVVFGMYAMSVNLITITCRVAD